MGIPMTRFTYVILGFTLMVVPAAADFATLRVQLAQIQTVAQCESYGKAHKCQATYDRRDKACKCMGR
jgi:hypothetical protein